MLHAPTTEHNPDRHRTRPATAIRKFIAPSLRESPAVAYSVAGGVLLLVVAWGPTPAFRNIWWILVFIALLALGVTMLRRETALELPAPLVPRAEIVGDVEHDRIVGRIAPAGQRGTDVDEPDPERVTEPVAQPPGRLEQQEERMVRRQQP